MTQKANLKKLADFWITPFLIGALFATGYQFTNRNLGFKGVSKGTKGKIYSSNSISHKNNQTTLLKSQAEATSKATVINLQNAKNKIANPIPKKVKLSNEAEINNKEMNLELAIKQQNQISSQSDQTDKTNQSLDLSNKPLKTDSDSLINPEIQAKEFSSSKDVKIIEKLFKSLTEP